MKNILTLILVFILVGCTAKVSNSAESEETSSEIKTQAEEIEKPEENSKPTESEMPPAAKKNPEAKVTITKFFDFACGYCRRGAQTVKYLQEKYKGQVAIEFRHFVVHPSVLTAHKASECAGEQGLFEDFFYEYFENHFAQTSSKAFKTVGKKIGMNQSKFEACLATDRTLSVINSHRAMGEIIGITGTPSFVINNEKKIPGALPKDQFEKLIQEYLDKS